MWYIDPMTHLSTLEDCVLFLTDKKNKNNFVLDKSDYSLFYSMAKQINNGIGFTEKQKFLIFDKISKKYLKYLNLEKDTAGLILDTTRIDIRKVVHVNTMDIVSTDSQNFPVYISKIFSKQCIRLEFSYNKKYLNKIKQITSKNNKKRCWWHQHGTKVHYFVYEPNLVYDLVCAFQGTKIQIQPELVQLKNKIQDIFDKKQEYFSVIDETGKVNPCEKDKKVLHLSEQNNIKIADRHRRYGMNVINKYTPKTTIEQIAYRKNTNVLTSCDAFSIKQICEIIETLDRYPLLVVLNQYRSYENIVDFHSQISKFVKNSEQSVLFREEKSSLFVKYIHENSINNYVDKNTKVVYINGKSLPKVLLKADWKPIACFQFTSFVKKHIDLYAQMHSDLIINYEKEISPFRKISKSYDELQNNNTR